MTVQIARRLFTAAEYEQMVSTGILSEDDRVELLHGEIVEMSPIGSAHAACVKRLNRLLTEQLGEQAIVGVQDPIRLDEHSEPQPDLAVLRTRGDFYASAHPGPADVLLLIEVADTSLELDRFVKLPLYAGASISEVWLVDLQGQRVEVHRTPSAGGYRTIDRYWRGDKVRTAALPSEAIRVDDILG